MHRLSIRSRSFLAAVPLFLLLAGCAKKETAPAAGSSSLPKVTPLPAEAFKAEISFVNAPVSLKAGATAAVSVKVKNQSSVPWPSNVAGNGSQINLSSHWWTADGKPAQYDGTRTNLPSDLAPGMQLDLAINVTAPATPGNYVLEADMVQESIAWFKDKGSKTARVPVKVE